jgi:hypothetical protein
MNRTENGRKRARIPAPASQDLNKLAIAFFGETQFTRPGDVACMPRQVNSDIGGGFKLKWLGKIATLVSATAITIASGFGAPAAGVKKELNPKADIQKYSPDHRAKLRWFFDEDPGSLKIEIDPKHYIAKISPTDRYESVTTITGVIIPRTIKARVIKAPLCQFNEGHVLEMRFDLPSDFNAGGDLYKNLYDITNISRIEIGHEYYVIVSCSDVPRLAYVIE